MGTSEEEVDTIVGDVLAVADVEFGHIGKHVDEVF